MKRNQAKKLLQLSLPKLVPDLESFTTLEYAESLGISKDSALRQIKKLLQAQSIKLSSKRVRDIAGRLQKVTAWEIVKDGK